MTWLPNTRLKKDRSRFSSEVTDNPYWEGNLNKENKARIDEFDFAVEQVKNAFDNLECMETSELDIDQEYHLNKVLSDEATMKAFKGFILGFVEDSRNDYVISMIECQSEETKE